VAWFFSIAQHHLVGQGLLIIEAPRSHSDTSHSVGLLWTSYQPDAQTSTWRHITLARQRHPRPPQILNLQANGVRPCGHWYRHSDVIYGILHAKINIYYYLSSLSHFIYFLLQDFSEISFQTFRFAPDWVQLFCEITKLFLSHTTASNEITEIRRVFNQTSRPGPITLRMTLRLSACASFEPPFLGGLGTILSHVSRLTITHGVLSEWRINEWQ
jgi:hypothetical protein